MRNIKLLLAKFTFIVLMLFTTSILRSQIVIFNGDTVNGAVIPANDSTTIHYCSTINVKVIPNGDTVGLSGINSYTWPGSGDTILTNGCTYSQNNPDTLVYLVFGNDFHYSIDWYCNVLGSVELRLVRAIPSSKICWVTVDSNFQHNVIIWDTTGFRANGIDSVKIYYYIAFNTKHLLKTCSRSMTYFVDSLNNPQSGTFKYQLVGVNGCGNIDTNSAWQTTAWIQQTGSTFTVSSPYTVEGNAAPVSYYILYRDTLGNGHNWDSIFETPGTVLNDPNYAHYPNAKYYVAAVLNMPGCSTPSIVNRVESMPANKSRSNRLTNNLTGIASINDANTFSLYPNPFANTLNLFIPKESDVKVYTELGQVIYQSRLPQGHNQIKIDGSAGIYLLSVNGIFKKLIKE